MKKIMASILVSVLMLSTVSSFQIETKAESNEGFVYSINGDEAKITGYKGDGGDIVIPATLDGYRVTVIAREAFANNTTITGVDIQSELKTIENGAFKSCNQIQYINFPEGLIEIAQDSFAMCESLQEISIPDSVTTIGTTAFVNCYSLTKVKLPKHGKTLGSALFLNCDKIETIEIPYGIKELGTSMFVRTLGLKNITIPESVEKIGYGVFEMCGELESVVIPKSVKTLGSGAFAQCTKLSKIEISKYIQSIESSAIPPSAVIYGYAGTAAEDYAKANGNQFVALTDDPDEIIVSQTVQNIGYQMNVSEGGVRTVYSVEPKIYGMDVVERGLIYGFKEYASEDEMIINENSDYVFNSAATENGLFDIYLDGTDTTENYVMTFMQSINNTNVEGMLAEYYVRVYAKLSDGTYVYSPVESFSIFDVAKKLYDKQLMNTEEKHDILYDKILIAVDPEYKKVEYSPNNSLVAVK